jgi:hypothetical protein
MQALFGRVRARCSDVKRWSIYGNGSVPFAAKGWPAAQFFARARLLIAGKAAPVFTSSPLQSNHSSTLARIESNQSTIHQDININMRCTHTATLVAALTLLLLASGVASQDPTTYLTAYPAQTITSTYRTRHTPHATRQVLILHVASDCGGSPYTITAQAWQIAQCVYTVKYTVQGRPGLSDFGFGYVPFAPALVHLRHLTLPRHHTF